MATLSSDKKYVTVVKGDTLWGIAKTHLGAGIDYKKLAAWNNIDNPDFIVVGQKIYLSKEAASGTTTSKSSSNSPTIKTFGVLSTSDDKLVATWNWGKESQTESYKVLWRYTTLDGVTLVGSNSSISVDKDAYAASRQSEFSIPSGAAYVYFKVKPISKTKDEKKKTTYFTANWSAEKKYTVTTPLEAPSTPEVVLDELKLTASVSGVKSPAKQVQFQLYKNNQAYESSKTVNIANSTTGYASCVWNSLSEGSTYTVRCRAVKDKLYSDWTQFSSDVTTRPIMPSGITTCKIVELSGSDRMSVFLEWPVTNGAKSYKIQYTTDKELFKDTGAAIGDVSETTSTTTSKYITDLDIGHEWFFRICSVDASNKDSAFTEPVSIVFGEAPSAPTTWSSTTTATVGEIVNLYWIHNSKDNSSETFAELELYVGRYVRDDKGQETFEGTKLDLDPIPNRATGDDIDKTKSYEFNTSSYTEGTVLRWRVRTTGVDISKYGDWSVTRTVDIHAQPTLKLTVETLNESGVYAPASEITSFPIHILAIPGPATQNPIGYHISVVADEGYETVDAIGNPLVVNAGEEVYSKFFDEDYELDIEISAGDITLEENISYTITVIVTMNSGLNAEESVTLPVTWTDVIYSPNAEIRIDTDDYTAYITPYCNDTVITCYKVNKSGSSYILTDIDLGFVPKSGIFYRVKYSSGRYTLTTEVVNCAPGQVVNGASAYGYGGYQPVYRSVDDGNSVIYYSVINPVDGVYTTTGELVYYGIDSNGDEVYFSEVEVTSEVENVWLSVYRREFDGGFTEIASHVEKNTTVTDPHPALDFARYRIVATSKDTGSVGHYDMPGHLIGGKEVIIQWNETWTNFEVEEDEELSAPPWSGSLLKLPYNIDVSDNNNPDVSLIEYIGRTHPVSYYGTHRGESSTWNVDIAKSDKETLYALRRLANWMGDVYVREPSGSGYWANITVSFSQKHRETAIPVTLSIKRVEGGI